MTASIVLQVIAIGIQTSPTNLATCIKRPSWLLRIVIVVPPSAVAGTLATTFLVPLAIGMIGKPVLGDGAARVAEGLAMIGTTLLVLIVTLLVWVQRDSIFPLLGTALPAIALFVGGSLLIGHVLGGPDPGERTALAVATVTRHPGLAILIATTSVARTTLVPPILVVVIGSAIVAVPYTSWRKHALRKHPRPPVQAAARVG